MGGRLADFKVPLHTGCIGGRSHVLLVPFVGSFRQLRTILAYRPRSPLVETDGQFDVQVREISFIKFCHVVIGNRIGDFPLRYLGDQVFCRNAVVGDLMDAYASAEFLVQIGQTVIILSGLHIDVFAYQFRYIRQRFVLSSCPLDKYLMCNDFFPTVYQAVFQLFRDRHIVCYDISFASQ